VDVPNSGTTALMFASASGHEGAVRLLLEAGAEVDLKNNSGATALMHASVQGHDGAMRVLLEACGHASRVLWTAMPKTDPLLAPGMQRLEEQQQVMVYQLAFTRYSHHQYCMVYGTQTERRWEGIYCAMVVQ